METKKSSNENSISLNKFISSTGICSRREADRWIEEGKVLLNGQVAKKGNRVEVNDEVKVDGKIIAAPKAKPIYIAFHKPPGIVCTTDRREPRNIIDYINHPQRLFPIGRLDKPSQGLIFLTNDGDIVNKILRAGNAHEKVYVVKVDKKIDQTFIKKMANGIPILGTKTKPCKVYQMGNFMFKIILVQGLNRQIRRMCEYLDYKVLHLKRIRIMHVLLEGIKVGEWRNLTEDEVRLLNKATAHSEK